MHKSAQVARHIPLSQNNQSLNLTQAILKTVLAATRTATNWLLLNVRLISHLLI
jgi:hypothetical protein